MSEPTTEEVIDKIRSLFDDFGGDVSSADSTLWELDALLENLPPLMKQLEEIDARGGNQ